MPEKRPPRKVTQQDVEELEKVTAGLKKREIKYPEPEDGSLIIKDSACVTYPEPKGGDFLLKREGVDTHRVELKKIRPVPKVKIAAPIDVVNFVKEMEDYDRERFKAIHFDTKNRVLGVENIAEGTLNSAIVHPRETAKGAILNNAAGVIFVHNHPSGISQPSNEDDMLISKLRDAFKMLSIDVLDAIVIGKEGYYSYKEDMRLERMTEGGSQRIMEDGTTKDISMCKSRAIEIGKIISELMIRSTETPTHSVKEKELEKLKTYIDQLYNLCGVSVKDQAEINKIYREMWNAQVLATGEKMSALIQKLTSALFYAESREEEIIKEGIGLYNNIRATKEDACSTAMRAAMETMSKYCGEASEIEIDGIKFTLPFEVLQIRENADLTYDQRVKAIQESQWAQGKARGLCSKLFGQETAECIERVSRKLAEGMVSKEPILERAKAITQKLIPRT